MSDQKININIDHSTRLVTITHRGALDLAPSAVDLPFAAVKQLAAQIIDTEGKLEVQQAHSRSALVKPA